MSTKNQARRMPHPASDRRGLILCDLGNVLIRFDHRIAVRRILPHTTKSFEEIYRYFFDSPLTRDYEEGRISSRQFFARLKKDLALDGLTYKEFVPIWSEIFFPNPGMLPLLKALRRRWRLHLISNINALHYAYIRKKFPGHIRVFDKVVLSYKVGAQKPDPRIYRWAVAGRRSAGRRVLYADDRPDLVRAARRLGLRSILFRSVNDFKNELKRHGALV
jgi:putative hydrolase of the HAD superfamily